MLPSKSVSTYYTTSFLVFSSILQALDESVTQILSRLWWVWTTDTATGKFLSGIRTVGRSENWGGEQVVVWGAYSAPPPPILNRINVTSKIWEGNHPLIHGSYSPAYRSIGFPMGLIMNRILMSFQVYQESELLIGKTFLN